MPSKIKAWFELQAHEIQPQLIQPGLRGFSPAIPTPVGVIFVEEFFDIFGLQDAPLGLALGQGLLVHTRRYGIVVASESVGGVKAPFQGVNTFRDFHATVHCEIIASGRGE